MKLAKDNNKYKNFTFKLFEHTFQGVCKFSQGLHHNKNKKSLVNYFKDY